MRYWCDLYRIVISENNTFYNLMFNYQSNINGNYGISVNGCENLVWTSVHIWVVTRTWVSGSLCICTCLGLYRSTYLHLRRSLSTYLHLRLSLAFSLSLSLSLYIYIYIYIYIYNYIYIYIYISLSLSEHVPVSRVHSNQIPESQALSDTRTWV